jgi:dephospho-CoA kinase
MMKFKELSFNIIGIAGQTGSGKTTLAKAICQSLNGSLISFGSFVRSEASRQNIIENRANLQLLGENLIKELGYKEFVKRVLNSVDNYNKKILIIDGIRHVEIWKVICSIADKSFLIYLDVSEKTSLERVQKRNGIDISSIKNALSHPMEINTLRLREFADIVFIETSIDIMLSQVKDIIYKRGIYNNM